MAMRFRRSCAALLVCALAAGGALAQRMEQYRAPKLGTQWVYRMVDSGSYGEGVSQVPGRFEERVVDGLSFGAYWSPGSTLLVDHDGAWVASVAPDGKPIVSWEPPLAWVYPIEVGKVFDQRYSLKVHAQALVEIPAQRRVAVEAFEEVKVPAGTFNAFRIQTIDTMGTRNLSWYVPELGLFAKQVLERIEGSMQGGEGRREMELVELK